MAHKSTNPLEDSAGGHSATRICHGNACQTCDYLFIGKGRLYGRVRSAPHIRPLSVAPRHESEQSTIYPETTLHSSIEPTSTFVQSPPSSLSRPVMFSSTSSAFLPSQVDTPFSPVGGYPTSTKAVAPSTVPSPSSFSLMPTPSNATLVSGIFPTNMPTVTPTTKNTHLGIIVGSVLGCLVAILLGVLGCYFLFRKIRKRKRRKVGYNNLSSEDECPYLQGDDHTVRHLRIDDLSADNEQDSQVSGQGRYTPLLRHNGQPVHYSYPLTDLTRNKGHDSTFSSVGRGELQSVQMEDHNDLGFRRSDVERLMPQQHDIESDSRAIDPTERLTTSNLAAHTSSSVSILSWARAAFGFARGSMGYHSVSSRTTVDIDQISLPRRLQKWQRPTQPRRGAG